MANNIVRLPIDYFPDPTKGRPVFNGSVYIGNPDTDPEVLGNRKTVTLRQEDGTEVSVSSAGQPLVTGSGGVILYNGSPVQVLTDGNYSIKVLNAQGSQVYYVESALDGAPLLGVDGVKNFKTLAEAVADNGLLWDAVSGKGDALNIAERLVGGGGGGMWDVVLSASVTENAFNIVQCTGVPTLSLELRTGSRYNVKQFGAVGDGVADDILPIQFAIDTAFAAGGGTVYLEHGTYLVTAPVEMALYVNLIGEDRATVITKTNTTTSSGGIDCVIYGITTGRFQISNLRLTGNRASQAATSHGFYLDQCSFFGIKNVRVTECSAGVFLTTSWSATLERVTASQCQGYGFHTQSACTSLVFQNCIAWGTGGAFNITGTVYSQLIACAADSIDAGNSPGDPFGSGGSGGDYQNPAFIYRIVGSQGITITSSGSESSFSKYLYCEGAAVTLVDCYLFGLECNATTFDLISLRGTGLSNVKMLNPYFTGVTNALAPSATIKGIFVENPVKQRLEVEGNLVIDTSFGDNSYDTDGLNFTYELDLMDLNQTSMVINADAAFIHPATDIAVMGLSGSDKILVIDSVTANVVDFDLPIPNDGIFLVQFTGTYTSSFDTAKIQIIEYDGVTTNILKSWTNSGGTLSADERFPLAAQSGYDLFFRIKTNHTTDAMTFTELKIKCAVSQT